MKKSHYMFIVIAGVYFLVAMTNLIGILNVGNNIFMALSLSALLLSISDFFYKSLMILENNNIFQCELQVMIKFLEQKEAADVVSPLILIDNYIGNLKMIKGYDPKYVFVNPAEFSKTKRYKFTYLLAIAFFVLGIMVFIFIPFINVDLINEREVASITLFAFAIMMLCMYLDEKNIDIQTTSAEIVGVKYPEVRRAFSDFDSYCFECYRYKKEKE